MPSQHSAVCVGRGEIGHIRTAAESKFCAGRMGSGHDPKSRLTLNAFGTLTAVTKGRTERKGPGHIAAAPPEKGNNDGWMVERGTASRIICCSWCVYMCIYVCSTYGIPEIVQSARDLWHSCFLFLCCHLTRCSQSPFKIRVLKNSIIACLPDRSD